MRKISTIRIIIFTLILITVMILIILGAISIPSNANVGLEFAGGTQARLQVTVKNPNDTINLASVSEVLLKRVDSLGVSNPKVEVESSSKRINVTLAGYQSNDTKALKNLLESSGSLTMNDSDGAVLLSSEDFPKNNAAYLTFDEKNNPAIGINFLDNDKFAKVTKDIATKENGDRLLFAYLDFDGLVKKIVDELNDSKLEKDAKVTEQDIIPLVDTYCFRVGLGGVSFTYNLCKPHVISRAQVLQEIKSNAILSGNFTRNEAQEIIDLINSGTINYRIKLLEVSDISPSYGQTAFNSILIASIIALVIIGLFLFFYYGIFGIISVITMAFFIVTSLFIFNLIGGEYSPDTIAAMIIGIGMASDSTIVTLERMKKDYLRKKTISGAYLTASVKTLPTILDSNITTFITAFMLFWFGTRTVKGFSIMLLNSIIWTLLISVTLNRIISYFVVKSHILYVKPYLFGIRYKDVVKYNSKSLKIIVPFFHRFLKKIRKQKMPAYYTKFQKSFSYHFQMLKKKKVMDYAIIFVVFSLIIIVIGMGLFFTYQPELGLDFTGGTRFDVVANKEKILDANEVTKAIVDVTNTNVSPTFSSLSGVDHLIYRIQSSDSLIVSKIINDIRDLNYTINFGTITPTIANELVKNALIAVGAALGAIFIYCFIRFSWTYSIAAIIAIIHDVLIMLAIITILRIELRMNAISAILAIIGYSINDTIVTFSKIREEINEVPKTYVFSKIELREIAEKGVRATFKRSILTSFTTMIAVLSLLVFGPEATNNFSILMLIGLVSGTYSSIFIASFLWIYLHSIKMYFKRKRKLASYTELYGPDEQLILGINI